MFVGPPVFVAALIIGQYDTLSLGTPWNMHVVHTHFDGTGHADAANAPSMFAVASGMLVGVHPVA